jgi:hypothetical protein
MVVSLFIPCAFYHDTGLTRGDEVFKGTDHMDGFSSDLVYYLIALVEFDRMAFFQVSSYLTVVYLYQYLRTYTLDFGLGLLRPLGKYHVTNP